jgi:hypothetical protein
MIVSGPSATRSRAPFGDCVGLKRWRKKCLACLGLKLQRVQIIVEVELDFEAVFDCA